MKKIDSLDCISRLKMPKASILQDTLTGNFCLISTC